MFHCIGCGAAIARDGKSLFSYTCPCGATIFVSDETGAPAFPASVLRGMTKGISLPHLEDLVGTSDYTSPEKEEMIRQLRARGVFWMQDCAQCRNDGTWAWRERMKELDQHLADIRARVALGEVQIKSELEGGER